MSFMSSLFGSQDSTPPAAPPFQNDPLVGQASQGLVGFGNNILNGIVSPQYQDLMQSNSPQFQAMLKNINANIQGTGLSTAAMTGTARGGAAQAGITQSIASNTANMSYQDLLNTQLNQKAMLGAGLDALSTGGNIALGSQGQKNNYAASIYNAGLGYTANIDALNQRADAMAGDFLMKGLTGLGSGMGSFAGMMGSGGGGAGMADLGSWDAAAGSSSAASAFGGTAGIDSLIAQGAPLMLAAA